jgi:hypothetical protein
VPSPYKFNSQGAYEHFLKKKKKRKENKKENFYSSESRLMTNELPNWKKTWKSQLKLSPWHRCHGVLGRY